MVLTGYSADFGESNDNIGLLVAKVWKNGDRKIEKAVVIRILQT